MYENKSKSILKMTIVGLLVLFVSVISIFYNAMEDKKMQVTAPEKDLKVHFWLSKDGVPYYKVVCNGKELIKDSKMGILTTFGELDSEFEIKSVERLSEDSSWKPIVGEQEEIRDCYHQNTYVLKHMESDTELGIEFRVYDEGVAFRYILPEVPVGENEYRILEEETQFVFPEGTKANVYRNSTQVKLKQYDVSELPEDVFLRPVTMQYADGQIMTICEANVEHYSTLRIEKDTGTENAFDVKHGKVIITSEAPKFSPWRALVMGDTETELLDNSTLVMNLNEEPDEKTYKYSEWVDAGTALMLDGTMTTDSVMKDIDQAVIQGIRYILLDSGWYGPEQDVRCDPRLDPSKVERDNVLWSYLATEGGYRNTGEGVFISGDDGFPMYGKLGEDGGCKTNIDIPAVCSYANEKGVGIILYVNGIFLPDENETGERFSTEELFSYFEKWGVAGVKPGFISRDAQYAESYLEEYIIKCAAKHRLVLTIHDEYISSGLERTYPNLLATEGILGDEGIGIDDPQIEYDIGNVFARAVQGPVDHTFCYPGKGTKTYALASPIVFRSGISMLYWYTTPEDIPQQDANKMGIWKELPQNWVKSLYLEGKMYEYVTIARKSEEESWYIGSLSAVERTLEIPLEFLDKDTIYVADIYADEENANPYPGRVFGADNEKSDQKLENGRYLVTCESVLERKMQYGFGYAVKLTKASELDYNLPYY